MRKTVAELVNMAEELRRRGLRVKALRTYCYLMRTTPHLFFLRVKIGELLQEMNQPRKAAEVLRACADYYSQAGLPLMSIVALTKLEDLDLESYAEALQQFAELYCHDSERIGQHSVQPPKVPRSKRSAQEVLQLKERDLILAASGEAANLKGIGKFPKDLPAVPFFSAFGYDTLIKVVNGVVTLPLEDGAFLMNEGDEGADLYVLAHGKALVLKKDTLSGEAVQLATLRQGALVGEIGLITKTPRGASIKVQGRAIFVKIPEEQLQQLQEESPTITHVLSSYCCRRILENVLATSVFFQRLKPAEKASLLKAFESRRYAVKNTLIEEGVQGEGVHVILTGMVEVTRGTGDNQVLLGELREGDIVGEISLVEDMLTTAVVTAKTDVHTLFLEKSKFDEVIKRYPAMYEDIRELSTYRLNRTASMTGDFAPGQIEIIEEVELDEEVELADEWIEVEDSGEEEEDAIFEPPKPPPPPPGATLPPPPPPWDDDES